MGKPTICIGENKGADLRLCFRYTDTIILLLKSEISSLRLRQYRSVCVGPAQNSKLLIFSRTGSFNCISLTIERYFSYDKNIPHERVLNSNKSRIKYVSQ